MANINQKQKKEEKASAKEAMLTYFKGVKAEWGKITWPQKNQIIWETGIVLFVVIAFTLIVYILDLVFKGLLGIIPTH